MSIGESDICEESLLDLSPYLPYIVGPPNDGRFYYSPLFLLPATQVGSRVPRRKSEPNVPMRPFQDATAVWVSGGGRQNQESDCVLPFEQEHLRSNSTAAILSILNFVSSPEAGAPALGMLVLRSVW